jgi:hypothetical protein
MAKKKSDALEKPARTPPTKPAEAKPSAAKKPTTSGENAPLFDTARAANAAAAMVGNKVAPPASGNVPARKESAAFKQLKAGLNKPSAGAMGGAFGIGGPAKKAHLPHGGPKQVGRNQTFGADVNRAGVPRRTPG